MKSKSGIRFNLGPVSISFGKRVKKRSWAELHAFFDTQFRGGKNAKGTINSQIEEYRSWIYIAVSAIYRRMGEIDFRFFRTDINEEVEANSPVYKVISEVFHHPNPFMDFRFLKQYTQMQLDLTGMAFVLRQDDPALGLPVALWPLNVNEFIKIHTGNDFTQWITAFEFMIGGKRVLIPPDKILYFHYPHPEDPRQGCSPIKAQAFATEIDHYIEVYERDFFKNSARFDFAIAYPEEVSLEEEDVNRIKKQWRDKFGGEGHFHELAVLDKGAKTVELSPKNEDLALMALAQWTQDKILAAYTVPPGKVGVVKDVNRANAVGIDITFNSECIKPRLLLHDDVWTRGILRRYDPRLVLRHNNPVPRDKELDIKEIKEKVGTPIWTINEARKKHDNLPPVEGGDVIRVPLNFIELSANMPLPSNEGVPPGKASLDEDVIEVEEIDETRLLPETTGKEFQFSKEYLDKYWYRFKAYTEAWENVWKNRLKILFEEQKEEVIQNLEKNYERVSQDFSKLFEIEESFRKRWSAFVGKYNGWSIKKIVRDIEENVDIVGKLIVLKDSNLVNLVVTGLVKDKVLDEILLDLDNYFGIKQKQAVSHILFDWDDNVSAFDREGERISSQVVSESGSEAMMSLGIDATFSVENVRARRWLGTKVRDFSRDVLATKYRQLNRTLVEGFSLGEDINKLSIRVGGVYDSVINKGYESLRIARTETISAANFGTHEGYEQSGVVEDKGWVAARDQRTRGAETEDIADHYHMNGQRKSIKDSFRDPRTGARMRFPGDTSLGAGPEDIIMCRCTLVAFTERRDPGPDNRTIRKVTRRTGQAAVDSARIGREIEQQIETIESRLGGLDRKFSGRLARMKNQKKMGAVVRDYRDRLQGIMNDAIKEGKNPLEVLQYKKGVKLSGFTMGDVLTADEKVSMDYLGKFMRTKVSTDLRRFKAEIVRANKFGRASHSGMTIRMFQYDSQKTLLHEYGHHIEDFALYQKRGGAAKSARAWRDDRATRRTGKLKKEKLSKITGNPNYAASEEAYIDDFSEPYIGKIYSRGSTEVVSMGTQNFTDERSLEKFYKKDFDHFSFIIGVLRGVF